MGSGLAGDARKATTTGTRRAHGSRPNRCLRARGAYPGRRDNGTEINFDVHWPGAGGQFTRTCQLVVKMTEGTQTGGDPFTTNMGEGPVSYDVDIEDEDEIESANLVCDELGTR